MLEKGRIFLAGGTACGLKEITGLWEMGHGVGSMHREYTEAGDTAADAGMDVEVGPRPEPEPVIPRASMRLARGSLGATPSTPPTSIYSLAVMGK